VEKKGMVEVILPSLVDFYKKLDHQIYYLIYIYTLYIKLNELVNQIYKEFHEVLSSV